MARAGRWIAGIMAAGLLCAADLDQARRLYERTDYQGALGALKTLPTRDAPAQFLEGQAYFMLRDFKKAEDLFTQALKADPKNSRYAHWQGKAIGRRAETAFALSQMSLAIKTRKAFEMAVELDPRNTEAMNDLFSYYLMAPGFMGGGVDKAQALADRIGKVDAAEGQYALAQLAEKRKEFDRAEEHYRRAAQLAPKSVGRLIDLAKFQYQRGKPREGEQTFADAARLAPDDPKLLFGRAEAYAKAKTNLPEARTLLKRYLTAPITPDDPPRADAEKLLREIGG